MNFKLLIPILHSIALMQGCILGLRFIIYNKQNFSLKLLGFFIITFAWPITSWLFDAFDLFIIIPGLFFSSLNFQFFTPALFYLYTLSLIKDLKRDILFGHLVPGMIESGLTIVMTFFYRPILQFLGITVEDYVIILYAVIYDIFAIGYILVTIRMILSHTKKIENLKDKNIFSWLLYVSTALLGTHFWQLTVTSHTLLPSIIIFEAVMTVILIYYLTINGEKMTSYKNIRSPSSRTHKTDHERYKKEDYEAVLVHISNLKLYTNPNLTINDLAKEINISPQKLSLLINHFTDKNFSTFINKLRIEEAKQLLSDPNNNHFTIQAISIASGFNSKSAFNLSFKMFTNMTPKEFKRNHQLK